MKNDRMNYLMEYSFELPNGKEVSTQVWIPTEIFCEAIRKFIPQHYVLDFDGSDSDIINFFADIEGAFDRFGYDEDFLDVCRELYSNSYYYEEDLEEVVEEMEDVE